MKNIIALALGAALVAVPARTCAQASVPATPQTGKVIILDNEGTMTGDIARDGDFYRVRRLTGEVSVPALRVVRLCASMADAYAFLRSRANSHDPDERIRLSDWCRQHSLLAEALVEIEAAARLRPEDSRLVRQAAALRLAQKRGTQRIAEKPPEERLPRPEFDSVTVAVFATKIQPMLMNTCAGCHTGKRGGRFDLIRTHGASIADRRSLDHNLAAVAAHIDPRDPSRSRLLTKAVTLHAEGMANPPLHGKFMMGAVRNLESWVRLAAANPSMQPPTSPVPPPAAVAAVPAPPTQFGESRPLDKPKSSEAPKPVDAPKVKEAPKPASDDPASPDAFNQEFHGEKPKDAPGR